MTNVIVLGILFLITSPLAFRYICSGVISSHDEQDNIKHGDVVLFLSIWASYRLLSGGLHMDSWFAFALVLAVGVSITYTCRAISKSNNAIRLITDITNKLKSSHITYVSFLYAANVSILSLTVFGCLFAESSLFTDTQILPKWLSFFGGLSLLLLIDSLSYIVGYEPSYQIKKPLITIACVLCILLAAYGLYGYNTWLGSDVVTGIASFDNVAGFASCLSFAIPFVIMHVIHSKSIRKYFWIIGCAVILAALYVCKSRTGWISCASVAILMLIFSPKYPKTRRSLCALAIAVAASLALYAGSASSEKQNSIEGHKLIWSVGWEMVKDKPVIGHGYGSIEKEYMLYQAKYLESHKSETYDMVADNTKRVFNEYLAVAIQFGFVGLAVVLAAIALTVVYYVQYRRNCPCATAGIASILCICVFSMFSYPFAYPFTWLMLIVDLLVVFAPAMLALSKYSNIKSLVVGGLLVFVSLVALTITINRAKNEKQWKRLYNCIVWQNDKQALQEYADLFRRMSHNPYFLYNYTAELNAAGQYGESLKVSKECASYWADYDLELLTAYNYKSLRQYNLAANHFLLAGKMCPNRFEPLYNLMLIGKDTHDLSKANLYAKMIVDKKIKVYSSEIGQMRDEALELLGELE